MGTKILSCIIKCLERDPSNSCNIYPFNRSAVAKFSGGFREGRTIVIRRFWNYHILSLIILQLVLSGLSRPLSLQKGQKLVKTSVSHIPRA